MPWLKFAVEFYLRRGRIRTGAASSINPIIAGSGTSMLANPVIDAISPSPESVKPRVVLMVSNVPAGPGLGPATVAR